MKKTIAILLVAILAVGSVFALDASLSGKFTSKFAYDIEDNWLGFTEPDNDLDLSMTLSTEKENEGDVYAVIKAELTLAYNTVEGDEKAGTNKDADSVAIGNLNLDDSKFEITEASIYGNGWNLSILKAAEMPKYAKGWETYNDGDDSVDLKAPFSYKNDLGVTFAMDGLFQAGFSMAADFDENAGKNVLAWAATNDLSFGGVLVNASVGFGKKAADDFSYLGLGAQVGYATDTLSVKAGTDVSIGIPTEKDVDATIDADVAVNVNYADMVVADVYYATKTMLGYDYDEKADAGKWFGGSDDIDTYAAEIDYEALATTGFGSTFVPVKAVGRGFIGVNSFADVEVDTAADLVEYLEIENYVSAKVAFDMNAFDVPVKLTLVTMDLINNPYFDLEAYAEVAGFEITGFGGYQAIMQNKYNEKTGEKDGRELYANNFHFGAKVAYTIEPVGKVFASTSFMSFIPDYEDAEAQNAMSFELGLENTTLVSGATLKAGYKTGNIIGGDNTLFAQDKGEVYVSATIEF